MGTGQRDQQAAVPEPVSPAGAWRRRPEGPSPAGAGACREDGDRRGEEGRAPGLATPARAGALFRGRRCGHPRLATLS